MIIKNSTKLFLLASDHHTACSIADQEKLKPYEWSYLVNSDTLKGYAHAKVWLCKGYNARSDLSEVFTQTHRMRRVSFETKL